MEIRYSDIVQKHAGNKLRIRYAEDMMKMKKHGRNFCVLLAEGMFS